MIARKIAFGLVLLASIPLGCIPYAYPHLSVVPAVRLAPDVEQVHAFRVEGSGCVVDVGQSIEAYTLSRVPVSRTNRVPAQASLSLDRGFYVVGVALNYPVHHGHALDVRLYRPGYRLVTLHSGEANVEWTPAPDLKAQGEAIDELLAEPGLYCLQAAFQFGPSLRLRMKFNPAPGSHSAVHRDALLFAAGEYERLADSPEATEADADHFRSRAAEVRARAAE